MDSNDPDLKERAKDKIILTDCKFSWGIWAEIGKRIKGKWDSLSGVSSNKRKAIYKILYK